MLENADANSMPSREDDCGNSSADYLCRAAQACASGDSVLGMHLYLAAFEKACGTEGVLKEDAIDGLKQAWSLACDSKERSLAEYIFEKMEPYLTSEEVEGCAQQLQRMAFDKLEEFGLSREDLEDMTDMISQDFLGMGPGIVKVEHMAGPLFSGGFGMPQVIGSPMGLVSGGVALAERPGKVAGSSQGGKAGEAAEDPQAAEGAQSARDGESAGEGKADGKAVGAAEENSPAKAASNVQNGLQKKTGKQDVSAILARAVEEAGIKMASSVERITYADLAGYDNVIKAMRDYGVGMQEDAEFKKLVDLLNARHGLGRMPAADTLLFRSPAREDANRFMAATLGELGLPAVRMRMEENLQGMPVLCVMAQADSVPALNGARNAFLGQGALLLEDLDLWGSPVAEPSDDLSGFVFTQLSRGAREAINLVRSAVENPDVYVLASVSDAGEIDPFFLDLLEPLSVVDIDYPTPEERVDIWMDIARDHPSLRGVNRSDLVRFSAGMPRFDMYMAAREAIEEAYKEGLMSRHYVPVTQDNLFEKLAAYQPLDSREYRELEDAVIRDFRADLEHLDDLLK